MMFNPDEEMKEFPCCFTLVPGSHVTHERYKHLQNGLQKDLLNQECLEVETIRNKNLLAWVLFCLDEKEESFQLSQEMLLLTGRTNITALGNFVYISFRLGYKIKSKDCLEELRDLKKQEHFERVMIEALAEQAYAYSRLGGLKNTKKSKELYKICIERFPTNYLWKYGFGLVCRRLTKFDLISSNKENTNMAELTRECVKVLFEVAEHANDYLKELAYSQLATIRVYNRHREHITLFHNMTVDQLCKKALSFGRLNPVVLTQCGKSLKSVNIDEAIKLLKESLELKEHNTAYCHLGLCYQKKAELISAGKYFSRESARHLGRGRTFPLEKTRFREFQSQSPRRPRNNNEFFRPQEFQKEPTRRREFRNDYTGRGESQRESPRRSQFQNEPITQSGKVTRFSSESPTSRLPYCKTQGKLSNKGKSDKSESNDANPNPNNTKDRFQNEAKLYSAYSIGTLRLYVDNECRKLDTNCELVKEAIQCYKKAKETSHGENISAIMCLGKILFSTEQFEDALAQFNQIIDRNDETDLISIISAYEWAGKCLQKLSEISDHSQRLQEETRECFKMEAKEKFKKALSLAADLAIRNPLYANCEIKVWEAFRRLKADVDEITSQRQRYKEKIALLDLAKNKDIAKVIREMLEQGLEIDDIELFQKGLNCYLREKKFEAALAFLNIACTNSCLTNNGAWTSSEIVAVRATTYIATSWERLTKRSPDSRRVFQQMFQLRYGDCAGMISGEDEEESEIKKSDVLIVNDESANSEEQTGVTTTLARNLARVFKVIFGLDTANNLERNVDYGRSREEIQLEEIEKYSLVVLILGDQDSETYKRMLEATHMPNGPNIVVIFSCGNENCPKILTRNISVDITDGHWQQTKLLDPPPAQDSFTYEVVNKRSILATLKTLFEDKLEAVLRLFCLLVDEDFERHQAFIENPSQDCLCPCLEGLPSSDGCLTFSKVKATGHCAVITTNSYAVATQTGERCVSNPIV